MILLGSLWHTHIHMCVTRCTYRHVLHLVITHVWQITARVPPTHIAYQEEVKKPVDDPAAPALCKIKKLAFLNDDGGKTMQVSSRCESGTFMIYCICTHAHPCVVHMHPPPACTYLTGL